MPIIAEPQLTAAQERTRRHAVASRPLLYEDRVLNYCLRSFAGL